MPGPVNKSSSASKLNEFYVMQRMLIVFVVQSAALTAQDMRHPLPRISALLTFDACKSSIVDQVNSTKKLDPQGWLKILCRAPLRVQSRLHNPVTDALYSGSLDLRNG
jgi:hypothetical protein